MALSGSIYTNVSSHWRFTISWTATQSISTNQSTVTATGYWQALDSYGAVSSSATKTALVSVNHNDYQVSAAGMASLSANEKKNIISHSYTIDHNSDGTASFTLDGWFQAQVTLNGTYYDTINVTQTTFDLDTIPRKSTLTGGQSWTAPNATTFTISRADSSFHHTIDVYVSDGSSYGSAIQSITNVGSSYAWTPDSTDNGTIFDRLNNDTSSWNQTTWIRLTTYASDGTNIGYNDYYGTVSSPSVNSMTYPTSFNIGDIITGSITKGSSDSLIQSTIQLLVGSSTFTMLSYGNGTTWSFDTNTIASQLYPLCAGASMTVSYKITTYYNSGQVIRSSTTYGSIAMKVNPATNSPAFTKVSSYEDYNTTTYNMTKTYQGTQTPYIIQNQSKVKVHVLTADQAVAKNNATIKSYTAVLAGETLTVNSPFTSDIAFDFGTINATSNQNVTVTVTDSRGFQTSATLNVNIVPWSPPVVNATATRQNGFGSLVTVTLGGTISPVNVNGTNINKLNATGTTWQYAVQGQGYNAATTWLGQTLGSDGKTYTTTAASATMDNTSIYNVNVVVTDQFGNTPKVIVVGKGTPILFIDTALKSVGVNQFPTNANDFEVTGNVVGTATITANGKLVSGGTDFVLGTVETTRGSVGAGRAMVKGTPAGTNNAPLLINYAGDFAGGTEVQGAGLTVDGWEVIKGALTLGSTAQDINDANNVMGFGLLGSNDVGVVSKSDSVTLGSGSATWLKYNNYYAGAGDKFYTTTASAQQIEMTGNALQWRKSTNTPATDGAVTWGGFWAMAMTASGSNAQIQMGSYNFAAAIAAANTQYSTPITFPTPFKSGTTPFVLCYVKHADSIKGYLSTQLADTESATGFTLYAAAWASMSSYYTVNWIAFGQAA